LTGRVRDGVIVFGTTPPVFGTTPPVFGTTPPVFGTTPPVFGTTPPVFGTTPPVSGTTPPSWGEMPQARWFASARVSRVQGRGPTCFRLVDGGIGKVLLMPFA
jgi:hypothetical protein